MADLTPYQEPSWQKRAANALADGLMWMGMDGRRAQRAGDTATAPLSFLPPVSAHDSGVTMGQGYNESDPVKMGLGAAGAALSATPLAGSMIRQGLASSRDRAMADLLRQMPGRTHFDDAAGMRDQIIGNLEGRYGARMSEGYTDPVMMGRWRHDTPDIPRLTRGARPEYLDDPAEAAVVPANQTNLSPPPRTMTSEDSWRRYENWSKGWREGGENASIYRVDTPAEVANPDNPLRFRTKTDTSEVSRIERAMERDRDRLKVLGGSPRDKAEEDEILKRLGELHRKLDEINQFELSPTRGVTPYTDSDFVIPPEATQIKNSKNPYWWKTEDGRKYIDAYRRQNADRAAARDNVYPFEPPARATGGEVDDSGYHAEALRRDAIDDATWDVLNAASMLTPFGLSRGAATKAARAVPPATYKDAYEGAIQHILKEEAPKSRAEYEALYRQAAPIFDTALNRIFEAKPGAVGTTKTVSGPALLQMMDAKPTGGRLIDRAEAVATSPYMGFFSTVFGGGMELGRIAADYIRDANKPRAERNADATVRQLKAHAPISYKPQVPQFNSGGEVPSGVSSGQNQSLTRALDLARSIAAQYPTQ